jgi:hypothetical protein
MVARFGSEDVHERTTTPAASPATAAKPVTSPLKDIAAAEPRSEMLATIGRGSRISGKLQFDGNARIGERSKAKSRPPRRYRSASGRR